MDIEEIKNYLEHLDKEGESLNEFNNQSRAEGHSIYRRISKAFSEVHFTGHIRDHLKIDHEHQQIIIEPYSPILISDLAKLDSLLELEWKITSMSPYYPLRTLKIYGTPKDKIDNIFTRSKIEDKRLYNMTLRPFEKSTMDSWLKFIKEKLGCIKKEFCNDWFYYIDIKRYIDGWTIDIFRENIKYYEYYSLKSDNPILYIHKSIDYYKKRINKIVSKLSKTSKENLCCFDTPPPLFRDRLDKEIPIGVSLNCPKCEVNFIYLLYSLPQIVDIYKCECGLEIPVEFSFGYYKIKERVKSKKKNKLES